MDVVHARVDYAMFLCYYFCITVAYSMYVHSSFMDNQTYNVM